MRKQRFVIGLTVLLLVLAVTAVLSIPRPVLGQMTIPTRTPRPDTQPTSPPPEPTDDNGGGGGGNNNPNPTDPPPQETAPPPGATNPPLPGATSTAVLPGPTATSFAVVPPAASATPTSTAVVTVSPSPSPTVVLLGTPLAFPAGTQPFPTAVACGRPPTFQTRPGAGADAYAGPGELYDVIGLIGRGEARPIIGRAAFVSWWLVQLDASGRSGWVMDEAGRVQGDTGRVSIVSAPDLAGAAPTPGPVPWVPTPNPACFAGAASAGEAAAVDVAEVDPGIEPPSSEPVIIAAVGSAGDTAVAPTAPGGALDVAGETSARRGPGDAAADAIVAELAQEAEPLVIATPPAAPNLMPLAGLGLIVAAVVLGVYLRRGGAGSR